MRKLIEIVIVFKVTKLDPLQKNLTIFVFLSTAFSLLKFSREVNRRTTLLDTYFASRKRSILPKLCISVFITILEQQSL